MLYWLHEKARRMDVNKWPVGGARLETIGNIVYGAFNPRAVLLAHHILSPSSNVGSLMSAVNLVVIVESLSSLLAHETDELNEFHIPSIIAVSAALGVKFVLFLYCMSLRKSSSQVEVLWEDHRNDLWINGFGNVSLAIVGFASLCINSGPTQGCSCRRVGVKSLGVSKPLYYPTPRQNTTH